VDDHTLNVLDFPRIREILMDCAQTELGRESLGALRSGAARVEIELEFNLVAEFLTAGDEPALHMVNDIRPLLETGRREGVLSPQELVQVSTTLVGLGKVHEYFKKRQSRLPALSREAAVVHDFSHLQAAIARVVDEAGEVRDDATPELHRVRIRLRRMRNEIVRALEEIAGGSPELFQNRSVGVRAGRFVLPLRAEARNRFDSVLHDTSDSGHTLFVEPLQLLTEQNELARLRSAELDEVNRILRQLTTQIQAESDALRASLQGIARLDEICARKRFAVRFDALRPVISDRNLVQVINARHPLLRVKGPETEDRRPDLPSPVSRLPSSIVPLNFVLPDNARVVLISGPNAGGKTVAMKTVGLFALMMSAGLYLPAGDGTELPLFRNVFALIGDEQSLEGDLSSFSALLLRTKEILEQADESSLVLLDEIGGSTDPEEGSALAIAVLEELERRGAVVIATSHLGPLKAFVQDAKGMANAAMEFKEKPTYRLIMGVPGESSALEIAAGLGFPAQVLAQARKYMNEDWLNLSERLKELTAERDSAQRQRLELAREKEKAAALRIDLEHKSASFRQYEQTERKKLQAEQSAMIRETRREIENIVRQIKEQQASHESIKAAKTFVEQKLERADSRPPTTDVGLKDQSSISNHESVIVNPVSLPAPGDCVVSRTFARQGTVVEVDGSEAVIAFGNIRMRLDVADLTVLARPEPEPEPVVVDESEAFDPRLNVRGLTQEEARDLLERFLDSAEMHGNKQVSIVHGKGTGALRKMIWEHLQHDKRIAEVRFGAQNEGGNGVTFATMKA
jgi:DNA mismatch repair protein MutS2